MTAPILHVLVAEVHVLKDTKKEKKKKTQKNTFDFAANALAVQVRRRGCKCCRLSAASCSYSSS